MITAIFFVNPNAVESMQNKLLVLKEYLKNKPFNVCIALLVLFVVIVCIPLAQAGYWVTDDLINNQLHAGLTLQGQTFWRFLSNLLLGWYHSSGRIDFLGFFLTYSTFYICHKLIIYKIARILWVLGGYLSCALLVYQITRAWKAVILFLTLLPMFWTLPAYHTPLLAYVPLFPAVTVFICSSLWFFLKFLEGKNYYLLGLSTFFYFCALITREESLCIMLLMTIFTIVHLRYWKDRIIALTPALALTIFYLSVTRYAREHAVSMYNGLQMGPLLDFPLTFLKQFTAALPLSSYIFTWPGFAFIVVIVVFLLFYRYRFYSLPKKTRDILKLSFICVLFLLIWIVSPHPAIHESLALLLFAITFTLLHQLRAISFTKSAIRDLMILGLTFAILPAAFVSLSLKYQKELHFGIGYLPIYLQYAGAAFLAVVGITRWMHSLNSFNKNLLTLVLSGIMAFVFLFNNAQVLKINQQTQYPRDLLDLAYKEGILNGISPTQSVITFTEPYYFATSAEVIYENTGMKFTVKGQPFYAFSFNNFTKSQTPTTYIIDNFLLHRSYLAGYVLVSRVSSTTSTSSMVTASSPVLNGVRLFCLARTAKDVYELNQQLAKNYRSLSINSITGLSCTNKEPVDLMGLEYSHI